MRRKVLAVLSIVFISHFLPPGDGQALILVRKGQPSSLIVVSDSPLPSQTEAAAEFQEHLKRMSGAVIPIIKESEIKETGDRALILVGPTARTIQEGIDAAKFEREAFAIRSGKNFLILAGDDGSSGGNTRTGTLWAVYDFLQDRLGVRWIWPGELGTYIPKRETVTVADNLDIRKEPALFQRRMRLTLQEKHREMYRESGLAKYLDLETVFERLSREEADWSRRMRMGSSAPFSYGHAFTDWWEKYKDASPDVFALLPKGKRGPANRPDFVKMCVSNPRLWEMQLERFRAAKAKNPNLIFLNCVENDGKGGFCTCPQCRAWDAGSDYPASARKIEDGSDVKSAIGEKSMQSGASPLPASLSDRYARWYNELAVRAREIDPNAVVVGYAYNEYRDAPVKIAAIEPNVLIGVIGYNVYPMTGEQRTYWNTQWRGWSGKGASVFLRSNALFMCGHGAPYVFSHDVAADWQFQTANKMLGVDHDCLKGYWATTGPTYYVMARLFWDTDASVDSLLAEYYEAFGPAKNVVRRYFEYWERFTDSLKNDAEFINSTRGDKVKLYPRIYTDAVISPARAILREAEPLLKNALPEFRERARNLELGLEHAELLRAALHDGDRRQRPRGSRAHGIPKKICGKKCGESLFYHLF